MSARKIPAYSLVFQKARSYNAGSMKIDPLKGYLQFQAALQREKAALEKRLEEINHALSGQGAAKPTVVAALPRRVGVRRLKNKLSLRQAIIRATSTKPLTKEEILKAVLKMGYRFVTKKPMATLNSVLYAKRRFKNRNGRFSPAK